MELITIQPSGNQIAMVPGTSKYAVDRDGNVLSLRRNGDWEALAPWVNGRGYKEVSVAFVTGVRKTITCHALCAMAWIGERPAAHDINHIDGDKFNNALCNLEYVTRSENLLHAYRLKLHDRNIRLGGIVKTPDDTLSAVLERYKSGETLTSIAKELGCCQANLTVVLQRFCARNGIEMPKRRYGHRWDGHTAVWPKKKPKSGTGKVWKAPKRTRAPRLAITKTRRKA